MKSQPQNSADAKSRAADFGDGLALRASPSGAVEESEGREAQPINAVRADASLPCRTPQLRPLNALINTYDDSNYSRSKHP